MLLPVWLDLAPGILGGDRQKESRQTQNRQVGTLLAQRALRFLENCESPIEEIEQQARARRQAN